MRLRSLSLLLASVANACSPSPGSIASEPDASAEAGEHALATGSRALATEAQQARRTALPAPRLVGAAAADDAPAPIHGRIVDARTGDGVADVLVRLVLGDDVRRELQSDADGGFAFAPDVERESGRIWVRPPRGLRWVATQPYYATPLTRAQLDGAEELVLPVAERRLGVVTGLAVDAESGAPLPHFGFTLRSRGWGVNTRADVAVETDGEGRFVTPEPIRGGPVTIQSRNGEGQPVMSAQDCLVEPGDGKPWRLAFRVVPRFDVVLLGATPDTSVELQFWMLEPQAERPLATSVVRRDADGSHWVRSPRPPREPVTGTPLVLAIGSPDGLLFAARNTTWEESFGPEPLEFTLEPTAVLGLRLDPEPLPSAGSEFEGSSGYLHAALSEERAPAPMLAAPFRLHERKWLPAGFYGVRAASRFHTPVEASVSLEAGRFEELRLALHLRTQTRTVHGRIAMASGAALVDAWVTLHVAGEPEANWYATYGAEPFFCGTGIDHFVVPDEDKKRGTFTFLRVPTGDVRIETRAGSFASEVNVSTTDVGDLDLSITILDR